MTHMHFGHAQYLPIALPLFALLAGALALLLILVQIRVLRYAYMQLGVSSGTAFFLLFASLFGSYINIPIAALGQETMVTEREVTYFGVLVTSAAAPLKNSDRLGSPGDVVSFIGHPSPRNTQSLNDEYRLRPTSVHAVYQPFNR